MVSCWQYYPAKLGQLNTRTLFFLHIYHDEIYTVIIRYVKGFSLKHKLKQQWLEVRHLLWKEEHEYLSGKVVLLCCCPPAYAFKNILEEKILELQGQHRFGLAESPAPPSSPASLQVWEVSKNGEWLTHKNGKQKEAHE